MKRKWLLALTLVLLLAVGVVGCATATPSNLRVNLNQPEGIQVTGTGKVTLVPDIAVLSLGVSAQAASVAEAQSQAVVAMDKVMTALGEGGVATKDIQTQQYSIQPVTRWDDKTSQEIILGYRVTNMMVAKLRDVAKAGTVIDTVAGAGGDLVRISGIDFTVDKPETYYTEARSKAMTDAKNRAGELANLSGVKLGKPTYIAESGGYIPRPLPVYDISKGVAATTPISPGEMELSLSVQVNYAILN
ncbi:MAG: SIMPL domain-containing protein [Chloroflexota bacterium]